MKMGKLLLITNMEIGQLLSISIDRLIITLGMGTEMGKLRKTNAPVSVTSKIVIKGF